MLNTNIDLVNLLKYGNGKIKISNLKDLDSCFYLTFSLILNDKYVDFIKYRIDVDKNQPRLSDMCSYKNDKWLSQTIRENMELATRYTSTSIERRKAYQALAESQRSLKMGDTLGALAYLYEVPESHASVYDISLKRLRLAEAISDSVFYEVLYAEYQTNKSRYLTYRYAWAEADSIMVHEEMTQLAEDTGENDLIDSMYAKRYYWY